MLKIIKKQLRNNSYLAATLSAITGKPLNTYGEFANRIISRHKTFWQAADAEAVRNTRLTAADPIEQWQQGVNWQRKLSNKFNSREFARKFNCRVAELYWHGREYQAIPFATLPAAYVIRPTIGFSSGLVFLMQDSVNLMDKRTYTPAEITEVLAAALAQNPYLEFLVEEFVKTEKGETKIPDDYKFYMFDGEIAAIQVINRLGISGGYTNFYDQDWQLIDNLSTNYSRGTYQAPPDCLPEMIEQAKLLSKAYGIFARIDFYATDKGAVFGEFTPTPALGKGFTPAANKMLATYWDKYCNGKI